MSQNAVKELVGLGLISRSCSACPEYSDEVISVSKRDLEKLLYHLYPEEKRPVRMTKTSVNGVDIDLTLAQTQLLYEKSIEKTFEPYHNSLKREAQQWVSSLERIGVDSSWRDYVWIKKGKYTGFDTEKYEGNVYGITEVEAEIGKRIPCGGISGKTKYYMDRSPIRYKYRLPTVKVLVGLILLYGSVKIGEESTHRHAHS